MAECYVCDRELTSSNKYEEHIIINAIGGRLKSKNLMCNDCGNKYDSMDASLAKNFQLFSNFFNIKRDRGTPRNIIATEEETGKKYSIDSDDNQKLISQRAVEILEDGKVTIKGSFNDEDELRDYLETIKKRKYPNLNIEEALKHAKPVSRYLNYEPIDFQVGGDDNFRSILKTAINYFIYKEHSKNYITHLKDFLDEKNDIVDIVHFYKLENPSEFLSHSIFVKGDCKEKILYAIVELFGMFSFIVLMNENYVGEDFENSYSYDLKKNQKIEKKFSLKLTLQEIKRILHSKEINLELIQIVANKLFESRQKEKVDFKIENLSKEILDEYKSKLSEPLTNDSVEDPTSKTINKLLQLFSNVKSNN